MLKLPTLSGFHDLFLNSTSGCSFVNKAKEGGYVRIHVNDLERDFVEQNNAVVTPLQFMYPAG
jgi:hypothetical protein